MDKRQHIVVVEDEPAQRQLLLDYLTKQGYRVTGFESGVGLRRMVERELPALVLLDIGLPGEDGFAIARWLREKAKGMGHNYYGEPAWPNDLLYIFPVVIFGTIACNVGLAVLEPSMIGEPANPFATPLEILPEWYFFPVFQILRTVPNKLLGVLLMAAVPAGLLTVPFLENVNKFQNPFRRPVATTVFLFGTVVALWLGIGAALPIDKSLTLGLF